MWCLEEPWKFGVEEGDYIEVCDVLELEGVFDVGLEESVHLGV